MARYYGDFRSLDQSVDPYGQKYRVIIFTGYTGKDPYPYKKYGGYSVPAQYGYDRWIPARYVPQQGTNLVMTNHPVIVRYEGDKEDVYKTHRCSTMTVSFLQSSLNQDFINTTGNRVFVMLLKWKNEVVDEGDHMRNTLTGSVLNKITIYDPTFEGMDIYRTLYYGYDIKAYEKFCYNVEWVGFSTPEIISCEFDHTHDVFTLNCQDAYSTLKYKNIDIEDEMFSMQGLVLNYLQGLGVYEHVYVNSNIHFPGDVYDLLSISPMVGNPIRWMWGQTANLYNENGRPRNVLDTIDAICKYLNLTVIPWKDALIITQTDTIAGGYTTYDEYVFEQTSGLLWHLPINNPTYHKLGAADLADTYLVAGESFTGSNTNISSNNVFNKVKLTCDEYHDDMLAPDISDDRNLVTSVSGVNNADQGWAWNKFWEYVVMRPKDEYGMVKCYKFGSDYTTGSYPSMTNTWGSLIGEVEDSDLDITHQSNRDLGWLTNLNGKTACVILDSNDFPESAVGVVPHNQSFHRYFLFGMAPYISTRGHETGQTIYGNVDNKESYSQKMLYIKTKPVLFNGHQYLNIKGKMNFYANGNRTDQRYWHVPYPSNQLLYNDSYCFQYATVKCCGMYLNATSATEYTWQSTPVVTKLFFTDDKNNHSNIAGSPFYFASPIRNLEGLFFRLPTVAGYGNRGNVEIWFDRPLGPCGHVYDSGGYVIGGACYCALLSDFEVSIMSDTYVSTFGKEEPDKDNSEYEATIVSDAVDEYPEVECIFSSSDTCGLSYSEVMKHSYQRRTAGVDVLRSSLNIYNEATGVFGIPESHITSNIISQNNKSSITLELPIKNEISPISRIRWNQLPGKNFIVDSMEIDYEYETVGATIVEIHAPTPSIDTTYTHATRNYRRTRDIIFNGREATRNPLSIATLVRPGSIDFEWSGNDLFLTSTTEDRGSMRFNVDWGNDNHLRLSVPNGVPITATMNANGHVVVDDGETT